MCVSWGWTRRLWSEDASKGGGRCRSDGGWRSWCEGVSIWDGQDVFRVMMHLWGGGGGGGGGVVIEVDGRSVEVFLFGMAKRGA